ncbi:MAG: ABC transporter ATP-binding protein [Alphaproteobacteria bacterium]|nr:ABC transporter ATP-binding protein [Alphaproteobacteria bacterium]
MTALLALSDLRVSLGGRAVLRGLSLTVSKGEVVGVIGPNGAGKSTLLRAAMGLIPVQGQRLLGGDPVQALPAGERALRAAFLPQDRDIAWAMTVAAVVGLGRLPHQAVRRTTVAEDRKAVDRALTRMDLDALRDRSVRELSGGERARTLIARMLAQEAPLLVADEPTAGLDPAHQIIAMETFAGLARDGRSVVVSLHDLGLAARWCDRLVLMQDGAVVASGIPSEVLKADLLRRVYGIEAFIQQGPGGLIVQPTGIAG